MTKAEAKKALVSTGLLHRHVGFQLGDLLIKIEQEHGEHWLLQNISYTGLSQDTLKEAVYVASAYQQHTERFFALPFSYHREVVGLDPRDRHALLDTALEKGLNRDQLRELKRSYLETRKHQDRIRSEREGSIYPDCSDELQRLQKEFEMEHSPLQEFAGDGSKPYSSGQTNRKGR